METNIKEISPSVFEVKFSGQFNEQSNFPKFDGQPVSKLILNMNDLLKTNSMGILYWIRWWKELQKRNPQIQFQVEYMRMHLLSCASVVSGFLPEKTEILSFYLPYHNEDEGVDIQELCRKGVDYDDQVFKLHETITKSHEGKNLEFEIDFVPARDLRILGLKIEAH